MNIEALQQLRRVVEDAPDELLHMRAVVEDDDDEEVEADDEEVDFNVFEE